MIDLEKPIRICLLQFHEHFSSNMGLTELPIDIMFVILRVEVPVDLLLHFVVAGPLPIMYFKLLIITLCIMTNHKRPLRAFQIIWRVYNLRYIWAFCTNNRSIFFIYSVELWRNAWLIFCIIEIIIVPPYYLIKISFQKCFLLFSHWCFFNNINLHFLDDSLR